MRIGDRIELIKPSFICYAYSYEEKDGLIIADTSVNLAFLLREIKFEYNQFFILISNLLLPISIKLILKIEMLTFKHCANIKPYQKTFLINRK